MTIITSLISLFTKTPSRLNPSTFSSDMDTRLSEENSRITQMNDMSTQINTVAQEINQKAVAIYNQAITGGYSQAYIDRSQLTPYAELTASGGETLFIVADNSDVIVYKNSIELILTTDYTINVDGITIDFVTPLSASDFIQVFDATKLDSRIDTKITTSLDINSYTNKSTLVDADELLIADSATAYSLKKLTWANIKSTILSSFGVMINTLTSKTTPVSADEFIIGDSASSNASKKLTFANLISTLSSTFATLVSPAFTGSPTAPTQTAGDNSTKLSTTAYVDGKPTLGTDNFMHVQEQQPSGTAGGAGTSATETTRNLNTVLINNISGASLLAGKITLPIGTYLIKAWANAYSVSKHKVFVKEGTNYLIYGSSSNAANTYAGDSESFASGTITAATSIDIFLSHYIQAHVSASDYGLATSDGQIEIYADIKIWKVA